MKKITQENKDQILTDNPKVVVKFGASWCGPCKAYDRILDSIQSDDLPLYSCEVEDATEWFKELGIKAIPATLVFENGVEVERRGGVQSADVITKLLV
jgi:thioredoxin 1